MSSSEHPPASRDPRRTAIPPLHLATLTNGLRVAVVPASGNPYLTVHLLLPAGGLADPDDGAGLAAFCAQMLRHGTARHGERALSERLDRCGARLGTSTYLDYLDVGGDVTTLDPTGVDVLFESLAEIVCEPTFPAAEVQTVRALREGSIRRVADHNEQVAARAFEAMLFEGHPAARPVSGTLASLQQIERESLVEFHARRYRPSGAWLGIAGDLSVEEALRRAERHFGQWTGEAPAAVLPAAGPTSRPRLVLVDKQDPSLTQVHLRLGHVTPLSLHSPLLFAYRLAAQVLGGDFSARLNQRLRVKEGLTYGARFSYRLGTAVPGSAAVSTYVELGKLRAALLLVAEELRRFAAEGPSAGELSDARDKLVLGFPFRFETPGGTLEQHLWVQREGLPEGFLGRYQERLDAVGLAQAVEQAAQSMPHPERSLIVAVANAAQLDALADLVPGVQPEVISLADLGLA